MTGATLFQLCQDIIAVRDAAIPLGARGNAVAWDYTVQGKKVPQYLQLNNIYTGRIAGSADRMVAFLNGLAGALSDHRLVERAYYEDALYSLFREYIDGAIGNGVQDQEAPQTFYYALEPDSPSYLERSEVLYQMMVTDNAGCSRDIRAGAWRIVIRDDFVRVWSGACAPMTWSKHEVAGLLSLLDSQLLRTRLLNPFINNTLQMYQDAASIVVPSEAAVILSALTAGQPVKIWNVEQGRIRDITSIDRLRPREPRATELPGARIYLWGTGYTATVAADGSGTLEVADGMPVLANLNSSNPDLAGVSAADGPIALAGPPGADPLVVPGRTDLLRPFLLGITPNELTTAPSTGFAIELTFSRAMNQNSVTSAGSLLVTDAAGQTYFAGALAALPASWSELSERLTLTPTQPPPAGRYALTLTLPDAVTASDGLRLLGGPVFTATFQVVAPIGPDGGRVATAHGVTLDVPAGALAAPTVVRIGSLAAFSVTTSLLPADGMAYVFEPAGLAFAAPVQLTVPLDPLPAGTELYEWSAAAGVWAPLHAVHGADGRSLVATLNHFSTYAALKPGPAGEGRLYLPLVQR
jgi:hypothetical protein